MGWRRIFIGSTLLDEVDIWIGDTRREERRVEVRSGGDDVREPIISRDCRSSKIPKSLDLDVNAKLSNTNDEQKTQYDRIP